MENKNKLYLAILAVQQGAPFIDKSTDNPFFKSKYADLPAIWGAIKDLMGEHGLIVSHTMEANGDDYIITRVIHAESGQYIESRSRIHLQKSTAQEYGSYITYMRRYAVSAMLGLVTDEDDDGNKATQAQKKPAVKPGLTKEQAETKAYIDGLLVKYRAAKSVEELANISKAEVEGISKLTEEQQKFIDDKVKIVAKGFENEQGQ